MNRKDFFVGLLTGCLIAAFIACVAVSIHIIRRDAKEAEAGTSGTSSASSYTGRAPDVVITRPDAADMPDADDASILSDPDVVGKIESLEELIRKEYIDEVTAEQLRDGVYGGIMDAIDDPYAEYYTPEEWIEMQRDTAGIYYGIGAYLTKDTETLYPRITGVIKETPAEEAGLMEDDYIVEVEHEDVYDMDLTDVVTMIRGEAGTKVHLTIIRGTGASREELEYDVERRKVETPSVSYEMKDADEGIAYIQITEFDTATVGQFQDALTEAYADGARALVLDLRSNPGGSLGAVVRIAGMMLPRGRVVYTEDKYGNQQSYESDGANEIQIPMVVLVNGNSASASEILAGAIKDYGKGTLLGTTTFGKGIVQQIFTLSDGSAVKLTVSHYYTPNGNDIHQVGIEPDVALEWDRDVYLEDGTDNQIDAAMDMLKEQLP